MFAHLVLFLIISWFNLVSCRHNVTIDDPNPSIVYKGNWVLSANSSLNAGGAHMLTQDPTATATFTFTGVAIYFMSPLWPYTVNTAVSLDAGPPILLDLVDHSRPNVGQGPETVQSQVIWGAAGLPNAQHTLVISVGAGQPFAVVDTLIFTALDPSDLTTSSAPTSPTPVSSSSSTTTQSQGPSSTSSGSATTTSNASNSSSSSSHVLPIALGTAMGVLALVIIAVGIWFCTRRKRRPASEAWTVAGTPYPGSPQMGQTMSDAPPADTFNGGNDYTYAGVYQPYDNGWSSPHSATPGPIPGAMAPATAATLAHPYATATPAREEYKGDTDTWQGTTAQIAQRYMRSPNRYQPNTLSTITETSTPPLGGGSPLAHSPASYPSDIGSDAGVQGTGSDPSQSRGISFTAPEKTGYPHPPAYTPR